jgi:predicted metalloendopeptidase
MNTRNAVAAVAVVAIILAASCVFLVGSNGHDEKWYNVDIIENVFPEYQEQSAADNYYAYVLNDVYRKAAASGDYESAYLIYYANSVNLHGDDMISGDIIAMLNNRTYPELGDSKVLAGYYDSLLDMTARNALGVDAIKAYVEEIDSITTTDQVVRYVATGGSAGMYNSIISLSRMIDDVDGNNAVTISVPVLPSMDENYQDASVEKNLELYGAMLELFPGIDGDSYIQAAVDYDRLIQNNATGESTQVMTYSEVAGSFAFASALEPYHEAGIDSYYSPDSGFYSTISESLTQDNLMMYKSMAMYDLLMDASKHLDEEVYEIRAEWLGEEYDVQESVKASLEDDWSHVAGMLVGKYYYATYVDAVLQAYCEELIAECLEAAKEYYDSVEWIGDATSAKIAQKIDGMTVRCLGPTAEQMAAYDYSSVKADSYYGMLAALRHANRAIDIAQASGDLRDQWKSDMLPHTYNMFYSVDDNSINILASYVRELLRGHDSSEREYILGTVGAAICHEITHGFDDMGADYDEKGRKRAGWLFTEEEKEVFDSKVDALADYIAGFYIGNGRYLSDHMIGEVMADMGGSAITYSMLGDGDARKFFSALVALEFFVLDKESYYERVDTDEHPPGMYRVNMEVQQMQAFFDAYGIGEGDNMYLAPDDRVSVWA